MRIYQLILLSLSIATLGCEIYKNEDRKDFEGLSSYRATVANITMICNSQISPKGTCLRAENLLQNSEELCTPEAQLTDLELDQLLESFCNR